MYAVLLTSTMIRSLFLLLMLSTIGYGQQLITGSVTDKVTGKAVPFASIGVVGTSKGTSTNLEGEFSLSIEGKVILKITCVGYESLTINSTENLHQIHLTPIVTELNEVVILAKNVNARSVVRKAFGSIARNFDSEEFLQQFFYRHYCKDDSVYGRLIEASVDVLKHDGYRSMRDKAGEREEIRITQLRRSLDNTQMAQGHEPISIANILQADVAAYQSSEESNHLKFYDAVNNLRIDFDDYEFKFDGITHYDGQEVYKVSYHYKRDSILTTSGYIQAPQAEGALFITTDTHAIIKSEDIRVDRNNTIRTAAYYHKYGDKYYPHHFIREGENHFDDGHEHSFHIDLTSVEIKKESLQKFTGNLPGKEDLLKIPYDSLYWNTQTTLKATPLENEIIQDLGGGSSLNKQFYRYQKYEWSIANGGKDGNEKFNWFLIDSKGNRALFLFFWNSDFNSYISELEYFKRLNRKFRNKISFVLISLDDNQERWQQIVNRYTLFSDGIINYRVDDASAIRKQYQIKDVPTFITISKDGKFVNQSNKAPSDPLLEQDLKLLTSQLE